MGFDCRLAAERFGLERVRLPACWEVVVKI